MWKFLELTYTLAGIYFLRDDLLRVIVSANIKPAFLNLNNSGITNWTNVVKDAETRGKINDLLDVVLKEYPDNAVIKSYRVDPDNAVLNGSSAYQGDNNFIWKGRALNGGFEALTGSVSTLLPIHFLEMGLIKANTVARVKTATSYGSGFLIGNNFFVTNNHVIPTEDVASKTTLEFNYQKTADGLPSIKQDYYLDSDQGFATSSENDWTVVKVKGSPNEKFGAIQMKKVETKVNDYVNIIQHPGGEFKKIALYHNVVMYVDDKRIQYLTDTLPGSSGSPVFNSNWDVVALHHSGGWTKEPGTNKDILRNEGININLLLDELEKLGFI